MWLKTFTLLLGLLLGASYAQMNDSNEVDKYVGEGFENQNEGFLTQVRLEEVPIDIRQRAERLILETADARVASEEEEEDNDDIGKPKFGWNPFIATFSNVVVPIYLPSTTDPRQPDYYEFKVLENNCAMGYILLSAKRYQDFVTPAVHFEEPDTPTEKAVIQAVSNGYAVRIIITYKFVTVVQKQADVKKFVRSNAAGDVVAEDKDGKRLSEETIVTGESDCPCNNHQLKREELASEATQYEEIRKAAKSGWDELKINDEVGIAIPCNGYDFALSACSGETLNKIIPWEERCQQDLASPFIHQLVKLSPKLNKFLVETTENACELLEVYNLIDNDPCNITRFTVNGQKYYVTAADLGEYDPISYADPLGRGGDNNTTVTPCFRTTTYTLVSGDFSNQYGTVTIQNDLEPSLHILITPKSGFRIFQYQVDVSTFRVSKASCNEDQAAIEVPSNVLRLTCGGKIQVNIRVTLIPASSTTSPSNPIEVFPVQNPPQSNADVIIYTVCCEESNGKRYYDTKPWSAWYKYATTGKVPNYNQHSCCGCVTGSGSVAWAQSFGWADRRASVAGTGWSPDIFRSDGPSGGHYVAPLTWTNSNALRNYTQAIREEIGTFCASGSGATAPWDMQKISGWFRSRNGGSGGVLTKYNSFGFHEGGLMDCVKAVITERKEPAVMGIGWLTRYATAVAYAHRQRQVKDCWLICPWRWEHSRWVFVHQGWGGRANKWIELSTWFCGRMVR